MKLQNDLKLIITRLEDATDYEGCIFFKAKGYNSYKTTTPKGKRLIGYNAFTSIRLYPCNEEQYNEAKQRLFSQTCDKPKLKIVVYDADITTNLIGGAIRPIITVTRWDFEKNKLFNKKSLMNKKGE